MARPRKEHKNFSCNMDLKQYEKLEKMNRETGLPKTTIMERAMDVYYDKYMETGCV